MSIQVSYNQCPQWLSLPHAAYVSILKQFSNTDLKTISAVSKQWRDIAASELALRKILIEVSKSIPQPLPFFPDAKFTVPSRESMGINYRIFNLGMGIEQLMMELVIDYEIGTPKLHFWKPLPPHTFTVALGLYITKLGQTYQKKDGNEASISFVIPIEIASLDVDSRASSPFFESKSIKVKEVDYSGFVYFWPGNLNDQSSRTIQSNLSYGLSSGMRSIRQCIK